MLGWCSSWKVGFEGVEKIEIGLAIVERKADERTASVRIGRRAVCRRIEA